ncbi:hypothetical protein Y1Q_0015673 [Alligator mississippiensis]|uniref:Reverse transcriptase domain-containing protein n=1 Tax=Alligator mississippiensis TaxID=8496 RepID=A0A151NNZ2_ALLMI|nr:hypothetical protein Y1Q_0015673 [Alligator mississippiensis]
MSPWASPVVLVWKQDGTIRFCVDYSKLNTITSSNAYPVPRMDSLLDTVGRAKFISTLNLSKRFWQMALDLDTIAKSAFTMPLGLFEFTVLPFAPGSNAQCLGLLLAIVLALWLTDIWTLRTPPHAATTCLTPPCHPKASPRNYHLDPILLAGPQQGHQ